MNIEKFLEYTCTVFFVAFAVFLALVLFIKPSFMEPVTNFIHGFGIFSIGGLRFSVGGTIAIILFFGFIIPAGYGLRKKTNHT